MCYLKDLADYVKHLCKTSEFKKDNSATHVAGT